MSDAREFILNEAAEIAMGGWHSVEKARALACAVSDYLIATKEGAAEPGADLLISMAERHGVNYSRHSTMLDFARAVWRLGRDSTPPAVMPLADHNPANVRDNKSCGSSVRDNGAAVMPAAPSDAVREYPTLPDREDRPALNAIPYRVYTEAQMHAYVDVDRKERQLSACNFCLEQVAKARAALSQGGQPQAEPSSTKEGAAGQEQAGVVPDGWKLVPVVPSDAMAVAAVSASLKHKGVLNGLPQWAAMLEAAPGAAIAAREATEIHPTVQTMIDDMNGEIEG